MQSIDTILAQSTKWLSKCKGLNISIDKYSYGDSKWKNASVVMMPFLII